MSEDKANYNTTGSALDVQTGGDHYKDMKIQPVEFIHANGLPFIEGAIIKYVCRHKAKNGRQDLEKARHFIDMLLELEYPEEKDVPAEVVKKHPAIPEGYKLVTGNLPHPGDEFLGDDGEWHPVLPAMVLPEDVHVRRPLKGQDNG